MSTIVHDKALTPLGYQKVTSLSAAKPLNPPDGATLALVIAETQAVGWRDDGTAPTGTDRMQLAVNTPTWFGRMNLAALQFIELAASATLHISYYKG
jgi:hypothetical protein